MLWPAVRSRHVVGTSATSRPARVALTVSSRASSKPAVLWIETRVEEATRVELEVVGRVVRRDAGEPVQGQPRGPAHQPLEARATDLVAALHVARRGDDVGAAARELDHRVDDVRLVRAIRHRDQDVLAARLGDAGLHRVQDAPAQVVAQAADGRQLGGQALDDGHGRVLVEVVDDEDLVGRGDRAGHGAQDRLDRLAFLEDGHDDRQDGLVRHRRPASTSSRIHGMTSSSICVEGRRRLEAEDLASPCRRPARAAGRRARTADRRRSGTRGRRR